MKHRCPDEETLAAYFDGLLPVDEEAQLHTEMLDCRDCVTLIASLGMVLEAELTGAPWDNAPVPAAVTQRAQALWPTSSLTEQIRIAARWIGDQLAPLADAFAPMPHPALLTRGGTAAVEELQYELTVGDTTIALDLEVDGPGHIALTARPLSTPPPGLLLRVTANGETRALSSLTAEGATVPALPAGTYELRLECGDAVLGKIQLDLEPPT